MSQAYKLATLWCAIVELGDTPASSMPLEEFLAKESSMKTEAEALSDELTEEENSKAHRIYLDQMRGYWSS